MLEVRFSPAGLSGEPPQDTYALVTVGTNPPSFVESLSIQFRVIGAVMMRELHTRFGRNNVGYLWLILEPMILSAGVSSFHFFSGTSAPFGVPSGPFYAVGYITYIIFRNNVNRSVGLIESNKPLLYHRNVTLLDISVARIVLDAVASFGAMVVILTVFYLLGLGILPERPWLTLAALALMSWLSLAIGMMVAAGTEFSTLTERVVHPITYLLIPFAGMFSVMDELPPVYARICAVLPLAHLADLGRMGLKADYNSTYLNVPFVIVFNSVATLLGLLMLRVARRRMHFG